MKKAILIIVFGFLLSGSSYSANLNLECYGVGSIVSTMSKYDPNTGTTSGTNYIDKTNSRVNVSIGEKDSWIQMPTHLLPPIKKRRLTISTIFII